MIWDASQKDMRCIMYANLVAPSVFCLALLDDVVTWLARKLSLVEVTMWGIQFLSTVTERALLFVICSVALAATIVLTHWIRSNRLRPLVLLAGALVLFRGLYVMFPGPHDGDNALVLLLVLVLVDLPVWMPGRDVIAGTPRLGLVRWLVSVVVVPALAVGLINGWSLKRLALAMHRDPAVRQIAALDLDSLALDRENRLLYASGHGTNYLLAYNTENLDQPPHTSPVVIDNAQSFHYSPANHEIYVFNEREHALLVLNAGTLDLKKSVPDVQMTNGDSRIVYDRYTDTLFIASEGGYWGLPTDETGYPIAVVGRDTGQLVYTMKDCEGLCIPGLIDIHPQKPIAYLVFPKRVLAFNTVKRAIGGTPFQSDSWVDGMAFTPDGAELLVGAPLRGAILRFDAESLAPKGTIGTVFGVRTLAVDPERNLLLSASLATNMVDVIDLRTRKRAAKYYVGPWLRSICLDTRAGVAYVSSTEGLFAVNYASRLPVARPTRSARRN
jgi:DNA-binding beta-propeller fold protein YncE